MTDKPTEEVASNDNAKLADMMQSLRAEKGNDVKAVIDKFLEGLECDADDRVMHYSLANFLSAEEIPTLKAALEKVRDIEPTESTNEAADKLEKAYQVLTTVQRNMQNISELNNRVLDEVNSMVGKAVKHAGKALAVCKSHRERIEKLEESKQKTPTTFADALQTLFVGLTIAFIAACVVYTKTH